MRRAPAIAVCVVSLLVSANAAMACSCVRHPTAESILDGAEAVFTAVAQDSAPVAAGQSVTTFRVVESFKGTTAGASVRVLHPSGSSASCGVKFAPARTYTLAAHRSDADPGLATSLCSTWMFSPNVGTGPDLIRRMRAIGHPPR